MKLNCWLMNILETRKSCLKQLETWKKRWSFISQLSTWLFNMKKLIEFEQSQNTILIRNHGRFLNSCFETINKWSSQIRKIIKLIRWVCHWWSLKLLKTEKKRLKMFSSSRKWLRRRLLQILLKEETLFKTPNFYFLTSNTIRLLKSVFWKPGRFQTQKEELNLLLLNLNLNSRFNWHR